jgi:hypothetical protein
MGTAAGKVVIGGASTSSGTVSLVESTDGSVTVTGGRGPTVNLSVPASSGGIDELTGDVTAGPGTGSQAATLVGTTNVGNIIAANATVASKAPTASPTFTGTPAAPTATVGTNTTQIATTAFVIANAGGAVSSVFGRTGTVVAATNDYSVAQVTGAAPLASPTFTGTPAAPTATVGTNTTQIATTAFVLANAGGSVASVFGRTGAVVSTSGDYSVAQVTGAAPIASPTFTGTPAAPTATVGTNTTQLATTAFVLANAPAVSLTNAESYISADVTLMNGGGYYNITSVALAAGTWLVTGRMLLDNATGVGGTVELWLGPNSGSLTGAYAATDCGLSSVPLSGMGCPDITKIITLASPTTVYLNAVTNVAGGEVGVVVKHYSLISLIANVTGITAVKIG